jgi:CRISPR-associated protein Cas2
MKQQPTQFAFTAYSLMWIYVMFDLPTDTKAQRKAAARFRKDLLKDGFQMHQYSVYIRHCASFEAATAHIERVGKFVPDEGEVSILRITDKQFGDTIRFVGKKTKPPPKAPVQLEFF